MAECPLLPAKPPLVLTGVNHTRVKRSKPVIKALVEDTEDKGNTSFN